MDKSYSINNKSDLHKLVSDTLSNLRSIKHWYSSIPHDASEHDKCMASSNSELLTNLYLKIVNASSHLPYITTPSVAFSDRFDVRLIINITPEQSHSLHFYNELIEVLKVNFINFSRKLACFGTKCEFYISENTYNAYIEILY